jgi:hypothetical protein
VGQNVELLYLVVRRVVSGTKVQTRMKVLVAVRERITTLWRITMCLMVINERNFGAMYCLFRSLDI